MKISKKRDNTEIEGFMTSQSALVFVSVMFTLKSGHISKQGSRKINMKMGGIISSRRLMHTFQMWT